MVNNNIKNYTIAVIAILMVFFSKSAFAQTVPLDLLNTNDTIVMSGLYSNGSELAGGEGIYVGALGGTLNGASDLFFCYDLNHETPSFGTPYQANVVNPGDSSLQPGGTYAAFGLQPTWNLTVAAALEYSANANSLDVPHSAALQLAIWTILYDWSYINGNYTVFDNNLGSSTSNGFYISQASVNAANSNVWSYALQYLQQAESFITSPNDGNISILLNSQSITQGLGGVGTPEPQFYLILGSMLALTAVLLKKRAVVA